jgi:hypothetical protein
MIFEEDQQLDWCEEGSDIKLSKEKLEVALEARMERSMPNSLCSVRQFVYKLVLFAKAT